MCGIVAFAGGNESVGWLSDQRQRLTCATNSLAHRGPDDEAVWLKEDGIAGLGHRRLNVCGMNAAQPIFNETGNIAAVVNGELYDPGDVLRRRLTALGHQFATDGDSELAVHLFEQYGVGFVEHLRGEFAILIYDLRVNRLIAVRDRFGIKPLVFSQSTDGQWWFASQIQALAAAGLKIEVDEESVWHAMSFQYTLPDRTLVRNVRQLPPGHLAVLANGRLQQTKYWDCDYPRDTGHVDADPNECVDEFAARFRDAVRIRLRGDVPVVSHLSGGIDSASVLASAAQDLAAAFTVGFQGSAGYDETELACQVAGLSSIPLHEINASPAKLLEVLPDALRSSEGWAVNGHLPAKYLLNQAISQAGFKVALTGEGADELLAGYPHLRVDLSRHAGAEFTDEVLNQNGASAGIMLASGTGLDVSAIRRRLGYVPAFLEAKASLGNLLRSHLRTDFLDTFSKRDAYGELIDAIGPGDQLRGRHPVHQSMYLWNKTALSQYILRTLGDGCEAAHGVEGRLPMLDHRLFEWVRQCPLQFLLKPNQDGPPTEKWILRQAMRQALPSNIVNRPKHPFLAPPLADTLVAGGLERDVVESEIDRHPYMEPAKLRQTLDHLDRATQQERIATDPLWWTLLSSGIHHRQLHSPIDAIATS